MPSIAFAMTPASHPAHRFAFRGRNKAEYYEGELRSLAPVTDMFIEKSLAGGYSIYRLISRTGLTFRRTQSHIRVDRTDLTILWFVRHGSMKVSCASRNYVSQAGDCTITRSSSPFFMEIKPDSSGLIEIAHVVVPTHEMLALIGDKLELGRPFSANCGDLSLVRGIFHMLFEHGDHINPAFGEDLAQNALRTLCRALSRLSGLPPGRGSTSDRRGADVLKFIRQNSDDAELTARRVATACGISTRYLCYVLKANGTSFSSFLREARLAKAYDWLSSGQMKQHSISDIGYLVGFKAAAHFSRAFKARYGRCASDVRTHRCTLV